MHNQGFRNESKQDNSENHYHMLFATERIEDYVVLSVGLLILIVILVFY